MNLNDIDRRFIIVVLLAAVLLAAYGLDFAAHHKTSYRGLPTVPCIDHTEPVKDHYHVNLTIMINGQEQALPGTIGHDAGTCLREIHTEHPGGRVHIESTSGMQYTNGKYYTLGDFFNVWHKEFNAQELLGHTVTERDSLQVRVNGSTVSTLRDTPLQPGSAITIRLQQH